MKIEEKEINICIRTVIINQLRKGEHNVLMSHELTMNEISILDSLLK